MQHATDLISIIALGLVCAFIGGMLAQRMRLPPLVGYLVAGIAIGPFTPGFVGDPALASQLAELGVILLMFGVGLHFSIGDLLAVRTIALPGAIVQITVATAMGAGLAWGFGWGAGAGLVFGLALSVASTVVLLRALEGQGLLDSDKGRIAVGWLIVEDLAMVVALVLLPALAPSLGGEAMQAAGHHGPPEHGLWVTLGLTLAKVGVFVAVMLVGGRRLIPYLLGLAARTGSRELFTLAVLASAVGIAFASSELFGVSFALGAFFAGMVLAESDLSHQAAANSLPLQDAFAVLFFVSVGMLFDPGIVLREPLSILGVVGVIVLGKSLAAIAIVLAFGHPVGTALTIAAKSRADRRVFVHPGRPRHLAEAAAGGRARPDPRRRAAVDHPQSAVLRTGRPGVALARRAAGAAPPPGAPRRRSGAGQRIRARHERPRGDHRLRPCRQRHRQGVGGLEPALRGGGARPAPGRGVARSGRAGGVRGRHRARHPGGR
ncbi:Na-H-Exchanger domain-containing protein [Methylorubrum extorquens]